MFTHIPRILKEFDKLDPDSHQYPLVKRAVCVLLLSASKFRYTPWKHECIRRLKVLLSTERDCYLKAWTAYTESRLLRMQGQTISSHKALEEYVHGTVLPGLDRNLDFDARCNAHLFLRKPNEKL